MAANARDGEQPGQPVASEDLLQIHANARDAVGGVPVRVDAVGIGLLLLQQISRLPQPVRDEMVRRNAVAGGTCRHGRCCPRRRRGGVNHPTAPLNAVPVTPRCGFNPA